MTYQYDADGLLTAAGALKIQRDPATGFVTGSAPGSATESRTYDAHGAEASYTASFGGSSLYSVTYTRDALGRITSKTERVGAETVHNADLHDGEVPWYLPDDMVGITRGNDIYVRPEIYDPQTPDGIALFAHELVRVGQCREGMNWIKYLWSVKGGYDENSKYERPAYDLGKKVRKDLTDSGFGGCPCGQ